MEVLRVVEPSCQPLDEEIEMPEIHRKIKGEYGTGFRTLKIRLTQDERFRPQTTAD
jgi:hypothetical protein